MGQIVSTDSESTEYIAAFGYPSGRAFSSFEFITFKARTAKEAKVKAHEWAYKNHRLVDDRTWLRVTMNGSEIYRQQLGRS